MDSVANVYVASEQNVVDALWCAKAWSTEVTPRGGGHGNAGQAVLTGGITIDLSKINDEARR